MIVLNKKFGILIALFFLVSFLFADNYDGHWSDLLQLLFNRTWASSSEERKIKVMREAVFLTLDATNNQVRINDALKILTDFGIKNLPNASAIAIPGANQYHQRYTHRGWDFSTYPTNYAGCNIQQVWELRKRLLINTVDKVFKFSFREQRKKDSMAALLYYTHILGDHKKDSASTNPDRIRISGDRFNPTIISELEKHCDILFADKNQYRHLKQYFRDNKWKVFPTGAIMTDEELGNLQKFANDILEELFRNIPMLLRDETFFRNTFH